MNLVLPSPQELVDWLAGRSVPGARVERLQGDVSPRRYFRVHLAQGGTRVLAFYPPSEHATCQRFVLTTALLEGAGVPVPSILEVDSDAGLVLLEDLGPLTLYDRRGESWEELLPYYRRALEHRRRLLALPVEEVARLCPRLDGAALRRELDSSVERLLLPAGFLPDPGVAGSLFALLDRLGRELERDPVAPCHRDFMARNLVPRGEELVVIDHQDLRLGPRAYDLASLLDDSLFPPAAVKEALLAGELPGARERDEYHRAAAQRTLKAAGTFGSFARRGFPRHLPLVEPTLEAALFHLSRLEGGAEVAAALAPVWRARWAVAELEARLVPARRPTSGSC